MSYTSQKFNKPGVLRTNYPYGGVNPGLAFTKGQLCNCDREITLCDYTATVNVTASVIVTGFQFTIDGSQQTYAINNGAGIVVPAGGSAATTQLLKDEFLKFLSQYVLDTNADVVLTLNTLTFTSNQEEIFVLDNVVFQLGTAAFAQSNCVLQA